MKLNDSRDFKDAESVRSGLSHVPSQPVSFPPHPIPGNENSHVTSQPTLLPPFLDPGGMLSRPG